MPEITPPIDSNTTKPELPAFSNVKKNNKPRKKKLSLPEEPPLKNTHINVPIWLSVSEAAKLGGINKKTIRRAMKNGNISFKILKNRYIIDLSSLIRFLYSSKKLKNKLNFNGIGQYIKNWRK